MYVALVITVLCAAAFPPLCIRLTSGKGSCLLSAVGVLCLTAGVTASFALLSETAMIPAAASSYFVGVIAVTLFDELRSRPRE